MSPAEFSSDRIGFRFLIPARCQRSTGIEWDLPA